MWTVLSDSFLSLEWSRSDGVSHPRLGHKKTLWAFSLLSVLDHLGESGYIVRLLGQLYGGRDTCGEEMSLPANSQQGTGGLLPTWEWSPQPWSSLQMTVVLADILIATS